MGCCRVPAAAASVPPAFYCNSNCTGVMEHGARSLSTGWSPDCSSRIQSELNACPQFILRVMLSAAPVYGCARRKRRRRTCQRIHFSPYCRLKKGAKAAGEVYFYGKPPCSLMTPAGEFITWPTCFWCSIRWPNIPTIPAPQSHLMSSRSCLMRNLTSFPPLLKLTRAYGEPPESCSGNMASID